jgi:hypothetical protein
MENLIKNPPKFPRIFHWITSPGVQSDDKIHHNPENFLNVDVVIQEKLDGGNVCLWNGDVYARSTGLPARDGWFGMVRKHHSHKTVGQPPYRYYYGEDIFGIHSIEYDKISEGNTYRIFNIRQWDEWLSWTDVEILAKSIEILTVPVLFQGQFTKVDDITKWFEENIKFPSALGPVREGFVIRHAHSFSNENFRLNTAKYVRANHVQTDQSWRVNWQKAKLLK